MMKKFFLSLVLGIVYLVTINILAWATDSTFEHMSIYFLIGTCAALMVGKKDAE